MTRPAPHQPVLDATELAFWGTDFRPYGSEAEIEAMLGFPNQIRTRNGYDPVADCTVEVVEMKTAEELRDVIHKHHLAVVWDSGEHVEISLVTGHPVTEAVLDEAELEKRMEKVLQGLSAVMSSVL